MPRSVQNARARAPSTSTAATTSARPPILRSASTCAPAMFPVPTMAARTVRTPPQPPSKARPSPIVPPKSRAHLTASCRPLYKVYKKEGKGKPRMRLSVSEGMGYMTKQKFVYGTLRRAILRCELAPGERLTTQEVADQLEVSLIPVREALQLLQSEGLVEISPHVGASVAPISDSSVAEVFTLLEGLETVASRVAALRMSREETDALEDLIGEMDVAIERGDYEHWGELNTRLHVSIAGHTGMPTLREMTERVFDLWYRVQRCFSSEVVLQRVLQSQQEHHAILGALRERDEAALEGLIKNHNRNALEAYTRYMSSGSSGDAEESVMGDASKVGTETA